MNERGFTLVELLVALTIFALLAAAGVSLLSVSVASQELVKRNIDQTAATGRIASQLDQDFAQIVPRVWRNSLGAEQAAFSGRGAGEGDLASFVRTGPEGGVQRIVLRRQRDALIRVTYEHPDTDTPSRQLALAKGVSGVRFRFRQRGAWSDNWRPTRVESLPEAVEMILSRNGQADIRYLFIAGARAR
jgi:general secretion pathway protein J